MERRVGEELTAIRPSLMEELRKTIRDTDGDLPFLQMAKFLKIGFHPGGDHCASLAAVFAAIVDLRDVMLGLKAK